MLIRLGCIVEGHGEVLALPILIRRLAKALNPSLVVGIETRRIPKSQMVQPGEIERKIDEITRQIGRSSAVLILLDADQDCPAILARDLLNRCRSEHGDVLVSVVVAKCEYEAWFLASADSLAGHGGLPDDLSAPDDPESMRGAKEWLSAKMPQQMRYVETRHQQEFSRLIDLNQARKSRSFRKFEKEILNLISARQKL